VVCRPFGNGLWQEQKVTDEAIRTVTPSELLDIREPYWRKRIEVVSLAAEVLDGLRADHREQALEVLGGIIRRQPDEYHRSRVLRRWPAVHVVATTGVAADHYSNATFWPKLADLIGMRLDQGLSREWGEAFLANLRRLGLPTFDDDTDAGSKYVGRILMHSGMPTYCLTDYFALVHERRHRVPGITPEEFVSWAGSRAELRHLTTVDKPVARFLQYGGEFARDVTSRSFELLDVIGAGGDGLDVPLPERFRQVVRDMWAGGGMTRPIRASRAASHEPDAHPRLVIDPFGRGLMLRLPPVGETPDGRASWIVNLDGVAQTVATRALLPGVDDVAPPTDVVITHAVRACTAGLAERDHLQVSLAVVDDRLPLMAFTEDGEVIPAGSPIPARQVWLLFPGTPDSLQLGGDFEVRAESPLPPGWSGWSLVLADLDAASQIGVDGFDAVRSVRSAAAARIVAPEPVLGVRGSSGQPIYASLPEVTLPPDLDTARWEVVVIDSDATAILRWSTDSGDDLAAAWDAVPKPLAGTFTVRVRGPWGRGASRVLTIVSGLAVDFSRPWRRFVPEGLQPCEAAVRAEDGVEVSRRQLGFGATDRDTYLRVASNGSYVSLLVTPPHMAVAYQTSEQTTAPSIRPVRLYREDLVEEPGTLILDLGEVGSPTLHLCGAAGLEQTIEAGAGRAGIYRFDLAKLADTLARVPQAELTLDPDGHVVVAAIRPRNLFKSVKLSAGHLVFDGAVDLPGLTALVYATCAPWRAPAELPIVGGVAELPPALNWAGGLRVAVRLEDPWAPAPVPVWPTRGESTLVHQAGAPEGETPEESAVAGFLAGVGDLPEAVADLDRLWTIRGLLGGLGLGERANEVAEAVDRTLARNPRAALVSIAHSRLPLEKIPELMIKASLPWSNLAAIHEDNPPAWSRRSALPGMFLSAADGEWSAEELAEASGVCGDVITSLVAGTDPHSAAGRLGDATDLYDSNPSIRGHLLQPLRLVPKALLDADSRTVAAVEFVDARRDERLTWLCKNSRRILADLERLLAIVGDKTAIGALGARRHPSAASGWRLLPTISLGYAFASRHAARGHEVAARWIPGQQRPWADLAAVAPSMVTIDLILAELLTSNFYDQGGTH